MRSKQPPSQPVWPDGQLATHAPAAQTEPAAQATPQAPQWAESTFTSTHCPPHSVQGLGTRPVQETSTEVSTNETTLSLIMG